MKMFNKYKKIITTTILLAFLLPSFSFLVLTPKKARAIVPVYDAANFVANTATAGFTGQTAIATGARTFKETGYIPGINPAGAVAAANATACMTFDCISTLIMKQLIRAILESVKKWVKTGFNGQPTFITDFEKFFTDAALNASGVYLENYLDPETLKLICEPWRIPVYNKLKTNRNKDTKYPKCTLATVINNLDKFKTYRADFREGGWDAWFSLMAEPTNTPTGLYLQTLSTMAEKEAEAKEKAKTETVAGQGFISLADCAKPSPSGAFCEVFDIKSPGKWIENQVGEWTTTDLASLEVADELDELMSAFIGVMLNSLFTSLKDW